MRQSTPSRVIRGGPYYEANQAIAWSSRAPWSPMGPPKYVGPGIDRYIPGIALLLAFHEEHHANPIKELSVSVVAASADSIDVSLKFPKYTVYREGIPIPFTVADFQDAELSARNTTLNHA
ncbi:Vitellogenin-1 [Merluccius polli]|uniref:Vitellogenin-1 n=1 Tax=Merluccius polli TaxID=89951 RepID=A0AA47M0M8_MERPO|nr:Vitellogenin-1 [Merluccius polli]